jgi:EAL domain-containing protein (putative c-di-GMP-specific phosphodiesterase class I)
VSQSGYLIDRVKAYSLNPGDIVIEINESRTDDMAALTNFVERYKRYGFIIALDDIGSGFSNLNRIPLLNPDIIKIDRFILRDMNCDHYKKEVFKSLVSLASNTGALVIAEGIETSHEAILAAELGADMIQGFYFAKPENNISTDKINNTIDEFTEKYKITKDKLA